MPVQRPTLMLVTDRRRAGTGLLQIIDGAVDGGVDVVQIREKDLDLPALHTLARDIVAVVANRAKIVINSETRVALDLGIGLHLAESVPALSADLANLFGPDVLIGRSIHSAVSPDDPGIDYLLFGHVFATSSKPGLHPRGLDGLCEIVRRSETPVWAIGGITAANAASAIEHGAKGIAVIGAILDADDPRAATIELRRQIDKAAGFAVELTRTSA